MGDHGENCGRHGAVDNEHLDATSTSSSLLLIMDTLTIVPVTVQVRK